jgi:hypothetical protein
MNSELNDLKEAQELCGRIGKRLAPEAVMRRLCDHNKDVKVNLIRDLIRDSFFSLSARC